MWYLWHSEQSKLEQRCFSEHKLHTADRNWPRPSNSSERGTKHLFRVNLAQIRSAVPKISDENPIFVPGDRDLWRSHSNLSKQGTKHLLSVNLAQIRSAVPRDISYTNNCQRQCQKQNLTKFTVCGKHDMTKQAASDTDKHQTLVMHTLHQWHWH